MGISYALLIEAGKDQMLAGGAIVLGYGVLGSAIGLVIALFLAAKGSKKLIKRINIIMLFMIAFYWIYFSVKHRQRNKQKQEGFHKTEKMESIKINSTQGATF